MRSPIPTMTALAVLWLVICAAYAFGILLFLIAGGALALIAVSIARMADCPHKDDVWSATLGVAVLLVCVVLL